MSAPPSGIALILVVSVLAFAAIVGFAMLSTASMQAQTTANSNLALSADALAESGVDLACYYLLNPAQAPEPVPVGGYYDGGTISFGPNMPGTVELAITQLATPGDFRIVSIGRAGSRGLAHTVTVTVRINPGWRVKSAVVFNNGGLLLLSFTVNGDVQANALLTNLGIINGSVIAPSLSGLGSVLNGLLDPTPDNITTVPAPANVRDYSTYSYQGGTYTAVTITGLPTGTTLGPTPSNPAGIYKYNAGALTMNHNVTINGTLIVSNGDLNIAGGNNTITPAEGFPGLIVRSNVWMRGPIVPSPSPRDLTVNGLAWTGGSLKSSGIVLNAQLNINGALLFAELGTVDTLYGGKLTVSMNANKIANVNLDTTVASAGVKVLSYKQ